MQPRPPRPPSTPAAGVAALLRAQVAEWVRLSARRPLSPSTEDGDDGPPPAHRLVFVDAFARSGLAGTGALVPAGPAAPGEERAVEAVRALFEAAEREGGARHPLEACAVLMEEDPAHLAALGDALRDAGLGDRVRGDDDPASARPGEILLVEADFAAVAPALPHLLRAAQGLVWLAPPTPRRLPWTLLEPLLRLDGADLLLAFPHADLHRQARFGALSVADLPPHPRRVVEGISALFGDPRHGWLAEWRAAERAGGAAAAEAGVLAAFAARLRAGAGERVVKPVELALPGDAVLHLFHLAADPASALALNDAVRAVGVEDRRPERAGTAAPLVAEPEGEPAVLELFGAEEMRGSRPPPKRERVVDVAALADRIASDLVGRTVAYRDVLHALADGDAGAEEVRRAMALLKRSGRAVYRSLADDDAPVDFPTTPVPPAAAKRRRTVRDDGAGLLLGLDVDSNEEGAEP